MQVWRVPESDRVVLACDAFEVQARPHDDGWLRITRHEPDGRVVSLHDDLRALTRTTLRLLAADRDAVRWWVTSAADRLGVTSPDEDPVTALPRLAYPLLLGVPGLPVPAVPGVLPPVFRDAFRQREAKGAARALFGDRATRPVVRALCRRLETGPVADLFPLSLAVAARDHLQPDHLAAVLTAPADTSADPSPLTDDQVQGLGPLIAAVAPRRAVALLSAAIADATDRTRLKHTASTGWTSDDPIPRTWEEIAAAVSVTAPVEGGAVAPVAAPRVAEPDEPAETIVTDLELHRLTTAAELRRVSAELHNCLHLYAHQLDGRARILTVRRDGRDVYAVHVRDGEVVELKGDRNRLVPAADVRVVRHLLESEGHLRATRTRADAASHQRYSRGLVARAADVLDTPAPHRTDWSELAATLWALGVLDRLPEADDDPLAQVVRDLAARIVAGDPVVQRAAPRDPDERHHAARVLQRDHDANPRLAPWRRAHMAEALRHV